MRNIITSKKFKYVGLLVLIIMIIFALSTYHNIHQKKNDIPEYKSTKVIQLKPLILTGKIKADRMQHITLPQGKVQQILVDNGAHVTEGQPLVTMYSQVSQNNVDDFNQEILQQQRKVSDLKHQLDVVKSQDDQEELATAQTSYNEANDDLSRLKTKLQREQTKVSSSAIAPFTGTVIINDTETDKPNIMVYSDDLVFKANVSEYDYADVKTNANLKVTALASKESVDTKIKFISNEPTTTSKANDTKYEVTAPINGHFMNGQTARASVKQLGLSIPMSSVQHHGVYVVNKKHVVSSKVVTGKMENGHYKVEKGLHLGQTVIVNPDKNLHDGSKVSLDD